MAVAWNLDFARHVTPESDFLRLIISLYGYFPSVHGCAGGSPSPSKRVIRDRETADSIGDESR